MNLVMKIFLILVLLSSTIISQSDFNHLGKVYRFELDNAPFPHQDRANGHTYDGKLYSAEEHYSDSTTLVYIPKYFNLKGRTDVVVYFHGWNNNVDSMITQFDLVTQFYDSGINAILVMPEGPKNAPDSFGGKLEEKDVFSKFINETLDSLSRKLNTTLCVGNITLAGHSGAYRIIAYIIMRGGLIEKINKVILFDGLYADVEKYSYWIDHYNGKFINIYTPSGGTKRSSENLMECLTAWNIPFRLVAEDELSDSIIRENRIVFIESQLTHNEVISKRRQFTKFLRVE